MVNVIITKPDQLEEPGNWYWHTKDIDQLHYDVKSFLLKLTSYKHNSHFLLQKNIAYLHAAGGHTGRLVKDLKLVPAWSEGVVTDEVLQGRLLQPAGAEGGAAVGVLQDRVATCHTLWRQRCKTPAVIQYM